MVLPRRVSRQQSILPIRRLTTFALCLMIFIFGFVIISDVMSSSGVYEESSQQQQQPSHSQQQNHQNIVALTSADIKNNDSNRKERGGFWNKFRMNKNNNKNDDDNNNNNDDDRNTKKGTIFVDFKDTSAKSPLQKLLSAEVHLIDIKSKPNAMDGAADDKTSYPIGAVEATFCKLDFSQQREDPATMPMFRYLVNKANCKFGTQYKVDLKGFADAARSYDSKIGANDNTLPKSLNLTGVVFHESRCGSTLVANALVAMNPSEHRVYSESAPPITALRYVCGENFQSCSISQAASVLKDTMYLMGRSNDMKEKRVFFKIQSIGSLFIKVFQRAYPNTPWIYIYRDPVQVMMSQLALGVRSATCLQSKRYGSNILARHVGEYTSYKSPKELSDVQYCAAHLATLTQSAVNAIEEEQGGNIMGRAVNYADLPDILWKTVLPNHFGIGHLSEETVTNIKKISGVYSKGTHGRYGEFKGDSEKKEKKATPDIRDAAKEFLQESYDKLLTYGF